MSYTIRKTSKGTTIHAKGKDAFALFEAITRGTRTMRTESYQLPGESLQEYNDRQRKLQQLKRDQETQQESSRTSDDDNSMLGGMLAAEVLESALDTSSSSDSSCDTSSSDTGSCDAGSDFSGGGGDFSGGGSDSSF